MGKKINGNECLVSAVLVLIFGDIMQAKSSEIMPAVRLKEYTVIVWVSV